MRVSKLKKFESKIIEMYNDNYTMLDIANYFESNKRSVSKILKSNGVEIKRHKRKYDFYYKQSLNKEQKDILIGSLLGDGCVSKHHNGPNACRYIETHSIDQFNYSMWKYNKFKNFMSSKYKIVDNRKTKTFSEKDTIVFYTCLHKDFNEYYEDFYIKKNDKNVKIIPQNIEEKLTPLGLAVWYMDDGNFCKRGNFGLCKISTHGFEEKYIDILILSLLNKFNVKFRKVKTKKGILIQSCSSESKKFVEIIKPYIIPDMLYKINICDNPVETEDLVPRALCAEMP